MPVFHRVSLFCTMSYHFGNYPISYPPVSCIVMFIFSSRHQLEKTSGDDDDDNDDQCRRVTYRRSSSIFILISCIPVFHCVSLFYMMRYHLQLRTKVVSVAMIGLNL